MSHSPAPDCILIHDLVIRASVGVHPFEHKIRQVLRFDLKLEADLSLPGTSDDVGDTIDYDEACEKVRTVVLAKHHQLIESIAEEVAARLLADYGPRLGRVFVRVEKPGAVRDARSVAVEVWRDYDPGTP